MTGLFLVDNSVIQRLNQPQVRSAWDRLRKRGQVATCLPTLLEAGYSVRAAADHQRLMELEQRAKIVLPPQEQILAIAVRIQGALFAAGMGRSVGVSDLQIAATAIYHSSPGREVIVVHYDADFEHVASVEAEFRSEWIIPRGTLGS